MSAPTSGGGNPFREGLEVLREKGWCQGAIEDDKGRKCAIGGLLLTNPTTNSLPFLAEITEELFPDRYRISNKHPVAIFNDHPHTTFEDVEAVFEKAAVRWDERVD